MALSSPGRNGPRIYELNLTRQNSSLNLVIYGKHTHALRARAGREAVQTPLCGQRINSDNT